MKKILSGLVIVWMSIDEEKYLKDAIHAISSL